MSHKHRPASGFLPDCARGVDIQQRIFKFRARREDDSERPPRSGFSFDFIGRFVCLLLTEVRVRDSRGLHGMASDLHLSLAGKTTAIARITRVQYMAPREIGKIGVRQHMLNPHIGYEKAAQISLRAYREDLKPEGGRAQARLCHSRPIQ